VELEQALSERTGRARSVDRPYPLGSDFHTRKFSPLVIYFPGREIIVKPLVSANADYTYRLTTAANSSLLSGLEEIFEARPFMVQSFMSAITSEGDFSVFFFDENYSHTILKTPKFAKTVQDWMRDT